LGGQIPWNPFCQADETTERPFHARKEFVVKASEDTSKLKTRYQ
jgi:hypothetical protein